MIRFRALGVGIAISFSIAGCDSGGLLEVQSSTYTDAAAPAQSGPSVTEMVNGGTVAANAKYKVVFTLGQASPNQGPESSPNNRLNGGLVGAMNGK